MAQQVQILVTDDIDGSEATHSGVQFSVEGVGYEIDLNDKNYEKFEKALKQFVEKGRRVGKVTEAGTSRRNRKGSNNGGSGGRRADLEQIREWARGNGYDVAERGRVANTVVEAYDAAH